MTTKSKRTKSEPAVAPNGGRKLFGTDGVRGIANVTR